MFLFWMAKLDRLSSPFCEYSCYYPLNSCTHFLPNVISSYILDLLVFLSQEPTHFLSRFLTKSKNFKVYAETLSPSLCCHSSIALNWNLFLLDGNDWIHYWLVFFLD